MSRIAPERLAEVFVEVADTLVDDFDLIDFLQGLTTHASQLIDARAAGLMLADSNGRLQLMAASDERTEMLELFQAQVREGPCQDCFRQGRPVVNADLEGAGGRWPRFAPLAVRAGFKSVHAFPMRCRGEVIGALNMFGTTADEMSAQDVAIVQALADVATLGILQERLIRRSGELAAQLQGALNTRIAVEQAKGMLAHIHSESPAQAFERLRRYCRSRSLRLTEVAAALTLDSDSLPELTRPDAS